MCRGAGAIVQGSRGALKGLFPLQSRLQDNTDSGAQNHNWEYPASMAVLPTNSPSIILEGKGDAETYAGEPCHSAEQEPLGLFDCIGEEGYNFIFLR